MDISDYLLEKVIYVSTIFCRYRNDIIVLSVNPFYIGKLLRHYRRKSSFGSINKKKIMGKNSYFNMLYFFC